MIKLIEPSWKFRDPIASLVGFTRRGIDVDWLHKRASCFAKEAEGIECPKNHTVLHINALGDYETYGVNLNGDAFTREGGVFKIAHPTSSGPSEVTIEVGNRQTHPTFVKYGRVYRNHKNSDPKYSFGPVLKSAYNDQMRRVELLIAVPNDEFREDLEKLASGDPLAWSMSCKVPFDICTICGNKSTSRAQYCDHARNNMTDITKSGHQIGVFNDHMKYFDISRVVRPADRIAITLRLQKAAAQSRVQGGAELAELAGVKTPDWLLYSDEPKMAAAVGIARKMAELEKEIPTTLALDQVGGVSRPEFPDDVMDTLKSVPPGDVMDALSDAKICIPFKSFMKLVCPACKGDTVNEASRFIPGMFGRILQDDSLGDVIGPGMFSGNSFPFNILQEVIPQLTENYSLDHGPVSKRVVVIRIKKPKAGVIKMSSVSPTHPDIEVCNLLNSYAGYQIDLVGCHPDDGDLARKVVLGNYLS